MTMIAYSQLEKKLEYYGSMEARGDMIKNEFN